MTSAYAETPGTKRCSVCRIYKPVSEFYKSSRNRGRPSDDGYQGECKPCRKLLKRASPERYLVIVAKERAKKFGIPFDITADDIMVPEVCPVLGIELKAGDGHPIPSSPTIDRIFPALGYVKGNVQVISHRAKSHEERR